MAANRQALNDWTCLAHFRLEPVTLLLSLAAVSSLSVKLEADCAGTTLTGLKMERPLSLKFPMGRNGEENIA